MFLLSTVHDYQTSTTRQVTYFLWTNERRNSILERAMYKSHGPFTNESSVHGYSTAGRGEPSRPTLGSSAQTLKVLQVRMPNPSTLMGVRLRQTMTGCHSPRVNRLCSLPVDIQVSHLQTLWETQNSLRQNETRWISDKGERWIKFFVQQSEDFR